VRKSEEKREKERSDKRENTLEGKGEEERKDHYIEFNLLTEPFAELVFLLFALVLVFALVVSLPDATRTRARQTKAATTTAAVWSW
jgi:hypothetical protein